MADYYQYLQEWFCSRNRASDFATFKGLLGYWQKSPYPVEDFYAEVVPLFEDDDHLNEGLRKWIPEKFGKVIQKVEKARLKHIDNEKAACEAQIGSPLLSLPRELRDKIWAMVTTENVIHVSKSVETLPKRRGRAVRRNKYNFHMCTSPKGYGSVACPPGLGDHALCSISGGSDYGSWRAACKQMSFEMPDVRREMLSKNALQFADLETAEQFLFGLREDNRASITHLRLALPYSLVQSEEIYSSDPRNSAWLAICNYFSNPWDRETLHMTHEKPQDLKMPIYFYYSRCYYQHNSHRLYDRWQVGRGGTSWDIGISDLVYKGSPRLDIAMADPTQEEFNQNGKKSLEPIFNTYWIASPWIQPLLQFRNYDELRFDYYSPVYDAQDAVRISEEDAKIREKGITDLKDYLRGGPVGVQGPQICAFFSGKPYGSGSGYYNYG